MTLESTPRLNQQSSTAIPFYRWRGARPFLLDLDATQTGWIIALLLHREGECGLLPIAWARDCPPPDINPSLSSSTFHADALDQEAFQLTLTDLQHDGWVVKGRLDCHVTGRHSDADFWPKLQAYLWQSPSDKHEKS